MSPITSAIVVGIGMLILIVIGLWILNSMMEDDPHDQHFYGDDTSNLPKPPPEPEH